VTPRSNHSEYADSATADYDIELVGAQSSIGGCSTTFTFRAIFCTSRSTSGSRTVCLRRACPQSVRRLGMIRRDDGGRLTTS